MTLPARVPRFALVLLLACGAAPLVSCDGDDANGPGRAGDVDGDGVSDASDNCPTSPNPSQANADVDGFGDVCDCSNEPTACTNEGTTAGNCANGVDDDGDQAVDAADPSCTIETTASGRCANGVDDDGDGRTDCLDSGCAGTPGC